MKVLYRISESGNNKRKPSYVYDKQRMFLHFINVFVNANTDIKCDVYVFADNVSDATYEFLTYHYDKNKVYRLSLGNSGSFMYTVDFAIARFDDNERIYFAEDDYIYTKNAPKNIKEGLDKSDYSSGYDHPDKYINATDGGNPYIENGGEISRVFKTDNSHWKFTNSCCMTFATTVKTLKDDYEVFKNKCSGPIPHDFGIFCELIQNKKRTLASCIPGVSTHGEFGGLSPFIDWDTQFHNSLMIPR
jgi:hypothetical protein